MPSSSAIASFTSPRRGDRYVTQLRLLLSLFRTLSPLSGLLKMGVAASNTKRTALNVFGRGGGESKILVLGCMGSGKSTLSRLLAKMTRSTQPVFAMYQHTIQNNLLELWKAVLVMAEENGINLDAYEEQCNALGEFRHRERLNERTYEALLKLGQSPIYHELLKRVKRPELPYNYAYFMSSWERILQKGYIPTDSDLLHMYAQTVGVDFQTVRLSSGKYDLYELPGHHIFRRKWNDFLNHTTVVIFVVDLSELCHQAFYSGHLKDKTVSIFKDLLNNEILRRASFILLFNKKDLFDELSQGYDFSQLAPQMRSGQEALSFYRNLFLHLSPVKKIYNHVVSLTKAPNLNGTVVESLSNIFKSNKENVQPA